MKLFDSIKNVLKKIRWKWHRDITTAMDNYSLSIKQNQEKIAARIAKLEEYVKREGGGLVIQNSRKNEQISKVGAGQAIGQNNFDSCAEVYQAYTLFHDKESQMLFWERLQIALTGDLSPLLHHLIGSNRKGNPRDIIWMLKERINNGATKDELIIYGTDQSAKDLFLAIRKLGCKVDYICSIDENNPDAKDFYRPSVKNYDWQAVPMISEEELLREHKTAQIAVGCLRCWEARDYLVSKGVSRDHLFIRQSVWEKQYLDEKIMKPHQHEVYIDGGVYTLDDTANFIAWCKGEYDAVYAFEPDAENFKICEKNKESKSIFEKGNIHLLKAALWERDEELRFRDGAKGSSNVNTSGNVIVQGRSIDSVLYDKPVTFIKMDIEGAELAALKGAQQSIKKWKPRLAICIYHKPKDFIEIPLYVHSLVPEYKMFIRHYSTSAQETVLYCVCDKDM